MKLDRAYERIRIFGLEHEHNYRQKLGITTEFYDFSEALQFKNFADGKYYQPEIVSPETGERIGNKRVNKCYPGFKANPQTLTCEPQRDESAPEPQTSIFRPESIFKKMGGRSDATSPAVTPTAEDLPDTTIKRIDITNWESVKTPGARKSMFDRILELDGKEQLKAALEVTSTLKEAKEFIKARQREADSPNERSVKIKNDFAYQGKSLKWYAHDRGSDISPQHLFTVQKFWGEPKLFPDNIYFITKDKFVIDKLNGSLIYRGVMDSDGKPKYRDEKGVLRSDDQYNACPIGRNNSIEFANNSEECKIVYEETNTGRGLKADINEQLKDKEISQEAFNEDHQKFIDSQTQTENQNINLDALKKFIIEEIKYNRKDDELRKSRLGEVYGEKTSYLEAAFKSFIGEKSGNKNIELTYPGSIVDEDYSDVFGKNANPEDVFKGGRSALNALGVNEFFIKLNGTDLYIKFTKSERGGYSKMEYSSKVPDGSLVVGKSFAQRLNQKDIRQKFLAKRRFKVFLLEDAIKGGDVALIKARIAEFLKGKVNRNSEFEGSKAKGFTILGENIFTLGSTSLRNIFRSRESLEKIKNENKREKNRQIETDYNNLVEEVIEDYETFISENPMENRITFETEEIKKLAANPENSSLDTIGKIYSNPSDEVSSVARSNLKVTMNQFQERIGEDSPLVGTLKKNNINEKLLLNKIVSIYTNPREDLLGGTEWKEALKARINQLLPELFKLFTSNDISLLPKLKNYNISNEQESRSSSKKISQEIYNLLNEITDKSDEDNINDIFSKVVHLLKSVGVSRGLDRISEMHAICLAATDSNTDAIIVPKSGNFRAFDFFKVLTTSVDVLDYEIDDSKITVQEFKKKIESVSVKMEDGNYASGIEGFSGIGLTPDLNPLTPRVLPSFEEENSINSRKIRPNSALNELSGHIDFFKEVLNGESEEKILGFDNVENFKTFDQNTRAILIKLTEQNLDNPKLQEKFLSEAQNTKEPRFFDDFLTKSFTMAAASLLGSRTNLTQMELEYGQITSSQSKVSPKITKSISRGEPEATMQINENEEIERAIEESTTPQEAVAKLTELKTRLEKEKHWNFKF